MFDPFNNERRYMIWTFVLIVFLSMILILGYFTYQEVQMRNKNDDDKEEEIDFGTKLGYIILYGIASLFFLIFFSGFLLCCKCISRRRNTLNTV